MTDYIVTITRQIGIKADSVDDAAKSVIDGKGDTLKLSTQTVIRPVAQATAQETIRKQPVIAA